jgi:NOL1/NOP2/fmu family ribosome biogenesis protein
MALLKKAGEDEPFVDRFLKQKAVPEKLPEPIRHWIKQPDIYRFYRRKENIYLMPPSVWQLFQPFRHQLNIRKAGVKLAEEAHGKFNPSHDFALFSQLQKNSFPVYHTDKAEALSFLRKQDFILPSDTPKGWVLLCFEENALGWIKNMGNRCNNYYPKEWRIRLQAGA